MMTMLSIFLWLCFGALIGSFVLKRSAVIMAACLAAITVLIGVTMMLIPMMELT